MSQLVYSQCSEILNSVLDTIGIIPYALVDKNVYNIKSGKNLEIMVPDAPYKKKYAFLIFGNNVGDTLNVSLITINRHTLSSKKITTNDFRFKYDPFIKSGNYFLRIETKEILDEEKKPITGCVGVVTLERVSSKGFKKLQKIEWKKVDKK
jgi:hypothetical protein